LKQYGYTVQFAVQHDLNPHLLVIIPSHHNGSFK
jgi:hypothetical protein